MRWWQRSGNEQNKLIDQPVGCSTHLPFLTLTRPQRITLRRLDDISVSPVLEVAGTPLKQSFTHTHMPPHPSPEQVLLKQGCGGPLSRSCLQAHKGGSPISWVWECAQPTATMEKHLEPGQGS